MSTNSRTYDFVNHSYDYRPNWTPFGFVTIINFYQKTNRRVMSSKDHRSVVKEFIIFCILKRTQTRIFSREKNLYHPIKLMLFQIVFVDL